MSRLLNLILSGSALLGVMTLTGCLGTELSATTATGGSCTKDGGSVCTDYSPDINAAINSTACTTETHTYPVVKAGTFSYDPCPSADRVGSCKRSSSPNTTRYYGLGSDPYTTETARGLCSDEGDVFTEN